MTPTLPPGPPRTLLPLFTAPDEDPKAWSEAASLGPVGAVVVINLPADSIDRARPRRWATVAAGIDRLAAAGVEPLGHVSLGYATRPVVDLLADITRWAVLPVAGIFLDHAPAGPFQIGPVALAARIARRAGLERIVLNPGVPIDAIYRRLDVTVCTFEGPWSEYRDWSGEDSEPGDGHLVYAVPPAERDAALALLANRGAGLGLVTDRPGPYLGSSAPAADPTPAAAGAR